MSPSLPEGTRVDRTPHGVRIDLPPRPFSAAERAIGLFPLFLGGVCELIGLAAETAAARRWDREPVASGFLVLFALVIQAGGLAGVALGCWLLKRGRTTLRLDRRRLRSTERAFPFRWTFSVDSDRIRRIRVEGYPGGTFGNVCLDLADRRRFTCARGYPTDALEAVADLLAEVHGRAVRLRRGQALIERPHFRGQPVDSPIEARTIPGGVRIEVPPSGFRGGLGCALGAGILWSVFSLIATAIQLSKALQSGRHSLGELAFTAAFVGAGGFILSVVWRSARRSWKVELDRSGLTLHQRGIFRARVRRWPVGGIETVRADETAPSDSDAPPEASVVLKPTPGRAIRILQGRARSETEWVARMLTEELAKLRTAAVEPATPAPGGECQVCGSEMIDRIVLCVKCRTPHHRECWEYAGQCSTYGCREIRCNAS